jgi:prephenate dehydrogenase
MIDTSPSSMLEESVVIVGVGLIGGSIAAALKSKRFARKVVGVGRDAARLSAAKSRGLIDEAATDISAVIERSSLVVICTPVDLVVSNARAIKSICEERWPKSSEHELPLITDAASVKATICESLKQLPRFVGSHPIAGSHHQGFEFADAHLFENRTCIVTPIAGANQDSVNRIDRFWQSIGMQTIRMTPEDHDVGLAMTSHLPHLVAAALSATLTDANRRLIGTGFRDTTRISAGDPNLWSGIFLENAASVSRGIDEVQKQLESFKAALDRRDENEIRRLLRISQAIRKSLD